MEYHQPRAAQDNAGDNAVAVLSRRGRALAAPEDKGRAVNSLEPSGLRIGGCTSAEARRYASLRDGYLRATCGEAGETALYRLAVKYRQDYLLAPITSL
jgi:hypothetical protein